MKIDDHHKVEILVYKNQESEHTMTVWKLTGANRTPLKVFPLTVAVIK